jgi:hypothetical protein
MTAPLVVLDAEQLRALVREEVAKGVAQATAADALVPVAGCGLPGRTLRKLAKKKRISIVRLGRADFVRRSELLGLAEAKPGPPPSAPDDDPDSEAAEWREDRARKRARQAARAEGGS